MTRPKEHPGRPRSFDRGEALDKIVALFWENGFKRTTYPDIERATGLHRQSLFYAFGDKHTMFVEALHRYRDRHVRRVVDVLGRSGSPSDNIRAAFDLWLEDARRSGSAGCLMVNTAGELGNTDAEVTGVIGAAAGQLVTAFADAFARAQKAGEIDEEIAPRALAHLAVACGDGALMRSRAANDPGFAETSFEAFLTKILG